MVTPAPRDASTVIVARDTAAGVEVYMLRRSSRSKAVPDAYVFPGGTVDRGDRSPQARMRLSGDWRPAEPAFTYTAIRETYEECGVLFSSKPLEPGRLQAARTLMLEGKRSFNETLQDLDVFLDARAVHYFSRWITPPSVPQRFDARFFVASLPDGQIAQADEHETYEGRWIAPLDALEAAERGEIQIVFPTAKHLERLGTFRDVASLLAYADGKTTIPVTPEMRESDDGVTSFFLPPTIESAW
jgi:8-oxo-dGTP pyrophosphatase MutT (NUDIX family)